ncbi:MAG: sigma-70 family RNA polymerase sigma factor [Planctomycetota bacterium]
MDSTPTVITDALLAEAHWVHRLAGALVRDQDLAADVAQDALTAALTKPSSLDAADGSRRRAWLGGVVRRTAASAVRDRARRRRREERAARSEAVRTTDDVERLELHQHLLDAVRGLAEPYRSAVVLRYFDDLSPREIGRRKGIEPATVRQHLARGLAQVRQRLDRRVAGGRRSWLGAAVALLESEGASAGISWTPWMALMMSSPLKKFVAAATLIAFGLGAWALATAGPDGALPAAAGASATLAATPTEAAPPAKIAGAAGDRVALTSGATPPALRGLVLDPFGHPIADAKVVCAAAPALSPADFTSFVEAMNSAKRKRPETETTSATDGSFHLAPPAQAERLELRIAARGYRRHSQAAPRPTDGDADLGEVRLRLGAVLEGRVVDRAGRPVADAAVRRVDEAMGDAAPSGFADDPETGGVGTDRAGRFALEHAEPGAFVLRATHAQHPPAHLADQSVAPGGVLTGLVIVLDAGESIAGRVTGAPPGAAIEVIARSTSSQTFDSPFVGMLETVLDFDAADAVGEMGLIIKSRSTPVADDGSFELRGLRHGAHYKLWAVQTRDAPDAKATCSESQNAQAGARSVTLAYDPGASVRCRFVDAVTGTAITDLSVWPQLGSASAIKDAMAAMRNRGAPRTYDDGVVTLSHLRAKPEQNLSLRVQALGYEEFERTGIELRPRQVHDLGTVQLQRAPVVQLLVVDAADGAPVSNARITLARHTGVEEDKAEAEDEGNSISITTSYSLSADSATPGAGGTYWTRDTTTDRATRYARTDREGRASVNSFPGQQVRLLVEHARRAPHVATLTLPDHEDAEHSVALTPGGSVEVKVIDPAGQPIAEVKVIHDPPEDGSPVSAGETTDHEGMARFVHLAPGTHDFHVESDDRSSLNIGVEINGEDPTRRDALGAQTVHVAEGETATIELIKQPLCEVTGTVTVGGAPLDRARVQVLLGPSGEAELIEGLAADLLARFADEIPSLRAVQTEPDGHYRLTGIPPGAHRLRVTHRARAMATVVPITVQPPGTTVSIRLETTAVEGRVTDTNGRPVRNARVSILGIEDREATARSALDMVVDGLGIKPPGDGVRTDGDGRFVLRGVSPDQAFLVAVQATGYQAGTSDELRVAEGKTVTGVELALAPAGRIRIRVEGDHAPFAAVRATLIHPQVSDPVSQFGLLRKGRTMLRGLRPGTWQVELRGNGADDDDAPRQQIVEVIAGQRSDVVFAP